MLYNYRYLEIPLLVSFEDQTIVFILKTDRGMIVLKYTRSLKGPLYCRLFCASANSANPLLYGDFICEDDAGE